MSLDQNPTVGHWLAVHDGRIVVKTGKVDIGQRISTAVLAIVCQELALAPNDVVLAPVRTGDSPDEGMTSGSNSIEQTGRAIRAAAATLRTGLLARAADRFGGDDWKLDSGALTGPGTNRPIPMGEMIDADLLAMPVDPSPGLWRDAPPVEVPMRGIGEMVTGRYTFVHDIDVPGMLHARPVHPPHARARLSALDDTVVSRLREDNIQTIRDGSFLAVAGPDEWAVVQAVTTLAAACTWDDGGGLDEGDGFAHLQTADAARSVVDVDGQPREDDIPPAPTSPDLAARYERPFTMHGALAPSAALATWDGKRLAIVTHSQGIYPLRGSMAESLGMEPQDIVLTHAPGSGCYGHNGADDAAFEAALIARALPNRPILLKWSREDEHAWEPYGTAMAVELAASLKGGRIAALSAEAIAGTFSGRPRSGPDRAGPARILANHLRAVPIGPNPPRPNTGRHAGIHRNLPPIYDIPELRLVKNLVAEQPLRTSALRCLGAAANVFALESFMDELAAMAGSDPWDFRLTHLTDARMAHALRTLRDWCPEPAPGLSRGIACAQYKNAQSRVALAVDLSVDDRAEVNLSDAWIVADAGRVIDPAGLSAQMEGGLLQAASWTLCEAVTWDRGGVTSRDWDSYPVLRFDQVPEIQIHIVDSPDEPSVGAGEASSGPAIAAIANAVFSATGLRIRRLPITADAIRQAALA